MYIYMSCPEYLQIVIIRDSQATPFLFVTLDRLDVLRTTVTISMYNIGQFSVAACSTANAKDIVFDQDTEYGYNPVVSVVSVDGRSVTKGVIWYIITIGLI